MTNAVLISKMYKDGLDDVVHRDGTLHKISGRCSGDTSGLVLTIVGGLMRKAEPYRIASSNLLDSGLASSLGEARSILRECNHLINQLGYKFFDVKQDSISYEPWL